MQVLTPEQQKTKSEQDLCGAVYRLARALDTVKVVNDPLRPYGFPPDLDPTPHELGRIRAQSQKVRAWRTHATCDAQKDEIENLLARAERVLQ